MEVRKMRKSDLEEVFLLDQQCFLSPWGKSQFLYELEENPFATILVATIDNKIVGIIDYWITFEIGQINQIAVLEQYRQQKIATALLKEAFKDMVGNEVYNTTLEVRIHNESAIKFYLKHGFEITCVKKAYYDNGDDAYFMERKMFDVYDDFSFGI